MILKHTDINFQKDQFSFKKSRQFSSDFTFIPIQYDNKDILIQTPHCFIPFGLNQFSKISKKKYLDISFQEKNTRFIQKCFEDVFKIVSEKYSDNYQVEPFLKKSQYSQWMRFKVEEDSLFFDQNKNQIQSFPQKIFGIFIIQLSGLWIMNQKMWFNWNIIQAKCNLPVKLKEYAFIDEDDDITNVDTITKKIKGIPPPPPPPPPPPLTKYQQMLKLGIPLQAVEHKKKVDRIQASDLQKVVLKKTVYDKKSKDGKKDSYTPSIDEIRNALQSLQKIN